MKKFLLVLTVVVMASFLLVGCLPTTNNAPVIVTVSLPNAVVGTAYITTVVATDADDDALTFSLLSGPTDMVISEAGAISGWTPAAEGTEDVTVAVTDGTDAMTADYTITVEAASVTPVAPTITAIPDQVVYWDEDGWTYQVEVTLGTGTTLTYSLIGAPISMSISSTGLITWTTILDLVALDDVTVNVVANDGESDTATFIYEVREPLPAPPIDVTIEYATTHSYDDGTTIFVRGYDVSADCVPVIVTLSEAVEEDIQIRWNDGTGTATDNVGWVTLTGDDDGMIFTGCLPFDGVWDDCEVVCVEVRRYSADPCCPIVNEIIFTDIVTVDGEAPCASFIVTIEDCTQDPCAPEPGASMFWTTACEDICDIPAGCCGDFCSGVGDWSFVLDLTECAPACDTEEGHDCAITGEFECGCLLYDDPLTENINEGVHVIDVSIEDNVGNEFTDTWTLTFDTDSLVSFDAPGATVIDLGDGEYSVDYGCDWDGCLDCFPLVG